MAPTRLDVKSESWLDLTASAQLVANLHAQQLHWRASSQQPTGCLECSPATRGNQNQHLLIRLRQQSYLNKNSITSSGNSNRCPSVALSSNLSNSIDLNPSLVGSGSQDKGSQKLEVDFTDRVSCSSVNKLWLRESARLKSFRDKLGRRVRRTAAAVANEAPGADPVTGSTGVESRVRVGTKRVLSSEAATFGPIGRSWSSLSVRLSSKLNHITHSWKHFLYNYNRSKQKLRQEQQEEAHYGADERVSWQPMRAVSQTSSDHCHQQQHRQQVDRHKQTDEWVARHHSRHWPTSHSQPAAERPKSLDCSQPRQLKAIKACEGDNERRLASATGTNNYNYKQNSNYISITRHTERDSNYARLSWLSAQPQPEQLLAARDSSSSTTLVSQTQLLVAQKAGSKSGAHRSCRSLDSISSGGSTLNSGDEFDKADASAGDTALLLSLGASGSRLQTSDYWSTATSKSDYAGHKTSQQQQQVATAASSSNEEDEGENLGDDDLASANSMALPSGQVRMLTSGHQQRPILVGNGDQDYYLDVANATSLALVDSQQLQQQRQGQLIGSPALIAVDDADEQHQQQQPLLLANLTHTNIAADFGALGQPAQLQLHQQPAQPHMLLAPTPQLTPVQDEDYDDYAVPADESCRLERSQVELVQMIGEGQKGYVFLGKLQTKDGRQVQDVAIKTLKYETEQLIDKLMREAAMMRQLEHPHIIKFIGVCPETPALIAMELAELESKQYVHRDVASRNVLVCAHNCVKLADFGLSRNLQPQLAQQQQQRPSHWPMLQFDTRGQSQLLEPSEKGNYVAVSRGKLPVRWLAPESLAFRRFTSASDVWMFAVCSWEMFHFGQVRPWAQIRNNQVLLAIESGQRLARPPNCPSRLYQLMLQCWSYAPVQRPKFRDLKQQLWSIYLNERAREQIELEKQQQQRLLAASQREQRQQDRLVLLMSSANLAEKQHQTNEAIVSQNQRLSNVNLGQHQQQRLSASPLMSTNYTSNVSGYSSATAELSNNSSRSSSMGSLARQKQQQEQLQQRNWQQRRQAPLMEQQPLVEPAKGLGSERHAKTDSSMRRFQRRSPGHVLQKQRSQGSIAASHSAAARLAAELAVCSGGQQQRRPNQFGRQPYGYDDDALITVGGCLRRRRPLSGELRRLKASEEDGDGDDDEDDDDEDDEDDETWSSSEADTRARAQPQIQPIGSSAAEFGRQMRIVQPAVAATNSTGRQQQQQQRPQVAGQRRAEPTYDGLQSGAEVAMVRSPASKMIERSLGNAPMLHRPAGCAGSNGASGASGERQRLRPTVVQQSVHSNKSRPAYRQPSAEPGEQLEAQAQAEHTAAQQRRLRQCSRSSNPPVAQQQQQQQIKQQQQQQREQPDLETLARLEEQRQLALHQRLLGHIRPASRSSSSSIGVGAPNSTHHQRRSANLDLQAAQRAAQLEARTSVERVNQSLQILESLIADENVFSNDGYQHTGQQQQQRHLFQQQNDRIGRGRTKGDSAQASASSNSDNSSQVQRAIALISGQAPPNQAGAKGPRGGVAFERRL